MYLELYKEWMKKGKLPYYGLCSCFEELCLSEEDFDLIYPTEGDLTQLCLENKSDIYWGSGLGLLNQTSKKYNGFTPLRQNLILLLAAIHGEL